MVDLSAVILQHPLLCVCVWLCNFVTSHGEGGRLCQVPSLMKEPSLSALLSVDMGDYIGESDSVEVLVLSPSI